MELASTAAAQGLGEDPGGPGRGMTFMLAWRGGPGTPAGNVTPSGVGGEAKYNPGSTCKVVL